jgi:hypothetical protein
MSYSEVARRDPRPAVERGEDVFLLDVREPDEVEEWAYPIGVNIPLGQLGPGGRAPAGHHHRRGLPRRRALGPGGHRAQRGRLDGREPDRRGGRLGGHRARASGDPRASTPCGWYTVCVGLVGIEPTTEGL